jgi:hypothetical protein
MLTQLFVVTLIFRLYFVSCFYIHRTDGIEELLNMKYPFVNNVYSTFSEFDIFISLYSSVLEFAIVLKTISKTKYHKTHIRYYSAYDSRYDITAFWLSSTQFVGDHVARIGKDLYV